MTPDGTYDDGDGVGDGEAKVQYQYNATDEVIATVYPDGEIVQASYDASGQPTVLCNTAGTVYVSSAHYDRFGRLTSLEKGNAVTDTLNYYGASKNNRLQSIVFDGSNAAAAGGPREVDHSQTYLYNLRGQISTITDPAVLQSLPTDNSATYGYDDLGRLNYAFVGNSATHTYDYDEWGNITKRGGVALTYAPATLGVEPHQPTLVSINGQSQTGVHDANGNRLRTYSAGGGERGVVTYDAEDRVTNIDDSGGPVVDFVYDEGGQLRAKIVDDGGTLRVTRYYSALVEVLPDNTNIKSYFFGGLRVASVLETDSSWQDPVVASLFGESSVQYAANGTMRPVMLLSLTPLGQTAAVSGVTLLFVVLFLMPAAHRRRAVVGLRVSRGPALALTLLIFTGTLPWPLLVQPAEACTGCDCPPPAPVDISYFHYDHLGSPLAISNGNGEAVEQIRYNPYGDVRARFDGEGNTIGPPSADDVRYEFTGYEAERNTGLMYANARFYDPLLGSFLSHDPAAEFWSPYTYVGWDPANGTDPTGACELVCTLLVVAAIGFAASAINAAANGASFGQAMLAGAIGAGTAIVGYGLGSVLQPGLASVIEVALKATTEVAKEIAAAVVFVSGLGQAVHSASESDYSQLIGLGIGLALSVVAKGARPSTATDPQANLSSSSTRLETIQTNFVEKAEGQVTTGLEIPPPPQPEPSSPSFRKIAFTLGLALVAHYSEVFAMRLPAGSAGRASLLVGATLLRAIGGAIATTQGFSLIAAGATTIAASAATPISAAGLLVGGVSIGIGAAAAAHGVSELLLASDNIRTLVTGRPFVFDR